MPTVPENHPATNDTPTVTLVNPLNTIQNAAEMHDRLAAMGGNSHHNGTGYKARCPSHQDNGPSLTYKDGNNGQILANCFGACQTEAMTPTQKREWVAKTLHAIQVGEQMPEAKPSTRTGTGSYPKGELVATYTYRQHGEPKARKLRYEHTTPKGDTLKTFEWQRREHDSWYTGLRHIQQSDLDPYKAETIPARTPGTPVWVVEGEKDADRLTQEHETVISTLNGAPPPTKQLGLDFVPLNIIVDNDTTGDKHANQWAKQYPDATIWKVPINKHGADVSDLLDSGLNLPDLVNITPQVHEQVGIQPLNGTQVLPEVNPKPYGLIDWDQFWTTQRDPAAWFIPHLLPAGGYSTTSHATAGDGKSLLVLDACLAVATGSDFLGKPVKEGTILYIDQEQNETILMERLKAFGHKDERFTRLHYSLLHDWPPLDTPEGGAAVLAAAQALQADIVVIDTLGKLVIGEENSSMTTHEFSMNTQIPLKREGISLIRVDHSGKDLERGIRGSSAKQGDTDQVYRLKAEGAHRVVLECTKSRAHELEAAGAKHELLRETNPLRHVITGDKQADETTAIAEIIGEMDKLGLPQATGRDVARTKLREAGVDMPRNEVLSEAIKRRKHATPADKRTGPLKRYCGECGDQLEAGSVMHPACRKQLNEKAKAMRVAREQPVPDSSKENGV